MSQREYHHVSQAEFEEAIGLNGELRSGLCFLPKQIAGCRELVYEAIQTEVFSIRVYSSVIPRNGARDVGEDAIRFVRVFFDTTGKERIVGTEKRVNRIKTWRKNLLARIEQMATEEIIACPVCGNPMKERRGPHGKFLGCVQYPKCTGTRKVER